MNTFHSNDTAAIFVTGPPGETSRMSGTPNSTTEPPWANALEMIDGCRLSGQARWKRRFIHRARKGLLRGLSLS